MSFADDMLIGAKAIANECGLKTRQVYRLAELGEIPTFKLGGTIAARRSQLHARLTAEKAV